MRKSVLLCMLLVAVLLLPFFSTTSYGQEWSAAQKEVWKNVETYWSLFAQGNPEGYLDYVHSDYRGWSYEAAVPSTKASTRKWIEYELKTTKSVMYEINPVAIQIHGNIAFVDYYYVQVVKNAEGKDQGSSGRWTDILMKQGDKWVMIGDHGGKTSK